MEKNESMVKLRRWARVVEAANASNLSRSEWCEKMGITESAFYYWQRRVRKYVLDQVTDQHASADNAHFSDSASDPSDNCPEFFEIVIPESTAVSGHLPKSEAQVSVLPDKPTVALDRSGITIRCGSFSIDVSDGFSKSTFQSVLEVLTHV